MTHHHTHIPYTDCLNPTSKMDLIYIHLIMKTMCPPGYYNGFVATHTPGNMMRSYILLVPVNQECPASQARSAI